MRKFTPQSALGYIVLAVFVVLSLLPLWMAIKIGMSYPDDVFTNAERLSTNAFTIGNFLRVMGLPSDIVLTAYRASPIDFMLSLRNSLIYTALTVTGQIFFSALAGYAFARMEFPGRKVVFFAFLAATMIPGIVLFIPNFILIKELGLLNTFAGMVAPSVLMTPFAVFFMRQFFMSAPKELDEAAKLEGGLAVPDLLARRPADPEGADRHPGHPAVDQFLERVFLAVLGRARRERARHGRRAIRFHEPDRQGHARLDRTHGRHHAVDHPGHHHADRVRAADRGIPANERDEISRSLMTR